MTTLKKIMLALLGVMILSGCSEKRPSMTPAEPVDLVEGDLDGQWDV